MFFSMPVCRKPTSGMQLITVSPSSSKQKPQHAMRAGVLRAHIQQHRLALDGALGNQVLDLIQ